MIEKNNIKKDCNCISELALTIRKELLTKGSEAQKGFDILHGKWERVSIYPFTRLYSEFLIDFTFEKKDGSRSSIKKKSVSIFYSYCPFCGKKFTQKS